MNLASVPFNVVGGIVASLWQHGELAPLWEDYRCARRASKSRRVAGRRGRSRLFCCSLSDRGALCMPAYVRVHRGGWQCLDGHNSTGGTGGAGDCEGAWVDVVVFIPMGGLYIVSQILLIHFASASYMFLATAFLLPLQNVVLSWRLVMGDHKGTVTESTFVVGVICGRDRCHRAMIL